MAEHSLNNQSSERPTRDHLAKLTARNNALRQQSEHLREAGTELTRRVAALRTGGHKDRRFLLAALNLMEDAAEARHRTEREAEARLRVENALRQSEEQFRRAIEEAPIPVIMHAEDGQVLQISRTWTKLTGFDLNDMPSFDGWLRRACPPRE